MKHADIVIDCSFNSKSPELSVIKTNAKKEEVDSILVEYVLSQAGLARSPDSRVFEKRDTYHIVLKVDLIEDSFEIESDTNNHGLTMGILLYIINIINSSRPIEIQPAF